MDRPRGIPTGITEAHEDPKRPDGEPFGMAVGDLKSISFRLRCLGLLLTIIATVNLATIVIAYLPNFQYPMVIPPLTVTLAAAAIVVAALFERERKRGDALFEEISDELQWYVSQPGYGSQELTTPVEGPRRPPLDVRVALRTFVHVSDLPLIPGRFGPVTYIVIVIVTSAVSLALYHRFVQHLL